MLRMIAMGSSLIAHVIGVLLMFMVGLFMVSSLALMTPWLQSTVQPALIRHLGFLPFFQCTNDGIVIHLLVLDGMIAAVRFPQRHQ